MGAMKQLIDCAMKRETCDLVIKGARILNVFSGDVEEAEIIPLPTALVGEGKFFILTAKGDSMTGIGVDDGDLIVVREQNTCGDGDYAVVLVNGTETLLKTITYLPDKKAYLLHAENPDYDDRIERDVQIQGIATQVIKKL